LGDSVLRSKSQAPDYKKTLKKWISELNRWVVREEDLKKYRLVKELGSGGQAKVFLVNLPAG